MKQFERVEAGRADSRRAYCPHPALRVRLSLRERIKVRVRRLFHAIAALCSFAIFGCESTTNYVPAVTPEMAVGKKEKQVNLATLNEGRTLFVHRCIECHTLPPLWHYTIQDWREIVNSMSHRASLKPSERDAVIAYILAVRKQM